MDQRISEAIFLSKYLEEIFYELVSKSSISFLTMILVRCFWTNHKTYVNDGIV